ncbi:MAG: type III secretion system export apparatus subunit SctU [Chlamydiota bacterium]|jgi:type III secretion protein U
MAQKTEKATPKKLKDARKKGQVAKSQDFPSALTFITAIMATLFATSYMFRQLGSYIISMFKSINADIDLSTKAGGILYEAILLIFATSVPIMIIVAVVGVLTNFLVIGPLFSFEAMKFQFKRLNPIEGIKQKFKLKTLVELIKSILKITGAALIIYFVIKQSIPHIVSLVQMPVISSALFLEDYLRKIAIRVGIFFLAVAVFDLAFQKKDFAKQMMMEKFEIKQELKDTEGDPLIKGKRKEAFREIAYREGPSAARRARAIITNPIHIAVAIDYNEQEDPAPMILTMGQGPIADQIIKVAQNNHIPIMRNPTLAQTLFQKGTISDYIPEDTYEAVAEILKWISSLEENPDINTELFKI